MKSVINFLKDDFVTETKISKVGEDFNTPEQRQYLIDRLEQTEIDLLNQHRVKVMVEHNPESPCAGVAWQQHGVNLILFNIYHLEQFARDGYLTPALVDVVAHECKHIEQITSGRLEIDENMQLIFEGVEYTPLTPDNAREYVEQPWEKEAILTGYQAVVDRGMAESVDVMWNSMIEHVTSMHANI